MIQQTSKLAGLALSVDRAQPQNGDADVSTPPIMLDSVAVPFPMQQIAQPAFGTSTVTLARTSTISGFSDVLAPANAGGTTRLWEVQSGLWLCRFDAVLLLPSGTITTFRLDGHIGNPDIALSTEGIFSFSTWNTLLCIPFHLERWLMLPKNHVWRANLVMDNTGGTAPMAFTGSWCFNRYA